MPTEYYQDGATAYRSALSDALDDRVEVAWTGVGVVPRTITGGELSAARRAFGHPLVTMDNYPVNDYAQDRIFLGPYTGREPAVADRLRRAARQRHGAAARLPDPAVHRRRLRLEPARLPPGGVLEGGRRRSGGRRSAGPCGAARPRRQRRVLACWARDESAYLRPLIDRFWKAREAAINHGRPGGDADLPRRPRRCGPRSTTMSTAPGDLHADLAAEVRPWAEQLARYGGPASTPWTR